MTVDEEWLADRLLPGERVAWSGRPRQGFLLTRQDAFLVPFSLAWLSFVVFWEWSASRKSAGFATAWGGMFVMFGLYAVAGRFLLDAYVRRHMQYALTDRRLLIERRWPFQKFTAAKLDQLPQAELSERPDGSGTIRFGPQAFFNQHGFNAMAPSLDGTLQLLAIAGAREVFDLLQHSSSGDTAGTRQ